MWLFSRCSAGSGDGHPCPGVVGFDGEHAIAIFHGGLEFREVAEVRENRHAVLILLKHGKQHLICRAHLAASVLRFVQPGELFVAQVVGVVKGVISHRAVQPCEVRFQEVFYLNFGVF